MSSKIKAFITLSLFSIVFTEVLTGATPFMKFLNPATFLFLFALYALPVALIREARVRWHLGVWGVFFLGLAYGILNEGMAAKTLLRTTHVPIPSFDYYVMFLGVNIGFAILILVWHALHSVLMPILFTHVMFPTERDRPWLNKKVAALFAILAIAAAFIAFHTQNAGPISLPHFFAFLAIIIGMIFVAKRIPKIPGIVFSDTKQSTFKPLLLGFFAQITLVFILSALAGLHIPIAGYMVFVLVSIAGFAYILKRTGWFRLPALLFFGMGSYLGIALFFQILSSLIPTNASGSFVIGLCFVAAIFFTLYVITKRKTAA